MQSSSGMTEHDDDAESFDLIEDTHTDIVSSSRLQGFSDAVFATAATILILPIRKFHIDKTQTLKEALFANWAQFLVFLCGYLVICAVWESQIIRLKLYRKVDDVIVVLTLISLMITTLLPFTIQLQGKFGTKLSPIVLNAILLTILEILELIMFLYGFRTPALLTQRFNELPSGVKSIKKRQIYIKIMINCTLFLLAAVLSPLSYIASGILLSNYIITPLLRRLMVHASTCCTCCQGYNEELSTFQILTGRMDKERIETFSDAATAIIATLLVLDMTTENFPDEKTVATLGLVKTLIHMWQDFVAYIATFTVVALQWFVHHSVIQKIKVFTPLMALMNNFFLAFLAFSPFIATLANTYTGHITHDAEVAVRVCSIFIFLSSFMLLLIFLCANFQQDTVFYRWELDASRIVGNKSRLYLFLKTLILPCFAVVVFLCGLGSTSVAYYAYHFVLVFVPLLFVILKYIFASHCLQGRGGSDGTDSLHDDLWAPTMDSISNVGQTDD